MILYFFTETHLDNSISDADISLPGFEIPIRRDRNCSGGGGIIFYYKSFVNVIRRQDLEHGDLLECMWFELKTKFQSILININYRSVRQAPAYYWQYFDFMLKRALDENCNIICLSDLNINFMANIPTNIRDIIFINGFVNIINKPTHFDNRTGNYSLLDPILITDSISIIDSHTIHIDREFSDHDGTYVTIGCGFSNNKNYKRKIWDYKRADYLLMKQKISEIDWVNLITSACDIH